MGSVPLEKFLQVRLPPRLLTRSELRAYLGNIPWKEVEMRMKRGQIPGPLWKVQADSKAARWDIKAVDRALDSASGVPLSVEEGTAELDRAFGFR